MITIKKIESLKPRVKIRKVSDVMHLIFKGEKVNNEYIDGLKSIISSSDIITEKEKVSIFLLFEKYENGDLYAAEDIYFKLLSFLGVEATDWDNLDSTGSLDKTKRITKPRRLLLDRVRSPYNIGSIFRSAESFGIEHIYLRECGNVESPRCIKTSRGALESVSYSLIASPHEAKGPFYALETNGEKIKDFKFPEDATFIIGSEENGLSPDSLKIIEKKVTIPQTGAKGSLNVAVATGILLYSWSLN